MFSKVREEGGKCFHSSISTHGAAHSAKSVITRNNSTAEESVPTKEFSAKLRFTKEIYADPNYWTIVHRYLHTL